MCLAVPMKLVEIDQTTRKGIAVLGELSYHVDLSLVEGIAAEDYVIVHAGFAIERLDEKEAEERIALFQALSDSDEG